MRILFWNTHKNKNINYYIANLVKEYEIDILVLAEYDADSIELKQLFEKFDMYLDECNTIGCKRINIWSNYCNVKPATQNKYYSIQIIQDQFILCGVHLNSDLHGDRSDERLEKIHEIKYEICNIEKKIGSSKIIIIGDMNEMPYEKGCLNANGFHGLPALREDDKEIRIVNEKEYRKFYNPMWNLMGDFTYPPGTYFLNESKLQSPMWYMLDQVILSKQVLHMFKQESLKIITTCAYVELMDKNGHPDKRISDHFPIMCEIEDN